MEIGAAIFFTDYSMAPTELGGGARTARLRTRCGWPSIRTFRSPAGSPPAGQMELTKQYYDVMDPFVTLSAAAAVTTRLKLGTGVCLVIQRDTIQTAKSSPRSTRSRRAAFCSASAAAGMPRRWKTTALSMRPAP